MDYHCHVNIVDSSAILVWNIALLFLITLFCLLFLAPSTLFVFCFCLLSKNFVLRFHLWLLYTRRWRWQSWGIILICCNCIYRCECSYFFGHVFMITLFLYSSFTTWAHFSHLYKLFNTINLASAAGYVSEQQGSASVSILIFLWISYIFLCFNFVLMLTLSLSHNCKSGWFERIWPVQSQKCLEWVQGNAFYSGHSYTSSPLQNLMMYKFIPRNLLMKISIPYFCPPTPQN